MGTRLVGLGGAVAAAVVTAGCGLAGTPATEPPARSGQISIGDKTQQTQNVSCTQVDWALTIEASADPGRAQASLRLGGEMPVVNAVNIENIDNLSGVAGPDGGEATASTDGNVYTITGTVVGRDRATPGQTRTIPFEIKAPC